MSEKRRQIGIVLFDGVEELDAVGPWEVLAYWTQEFEDQGWAVSLLSPGGGPVTAAKGMPLGAQGALEETEALDVVVHPGGNGTRPLMRDEKHLRWLRERHAAGTLMTSVCTGALVLAAAGLLAGRPATTYWTAFGELLEADPSIKPRPEDRFVDDSDVITAAGVSAGIDMALYLVERLAGTERAREVRRGIQYDPEPPV